MLTFEVDMSCSMATDRRERLAEVIEKLTVEFENDEWYFNDKENGSIADLVLRTGTQIH